jgi:Protein of unknown function (DUF1236)
MIRSRRAELSPANSTVPGGTSGKAPALLHTANVGKEELMIHFRNAAMLLALVAGTSAATAQTTIITREPVETQAVVGTRVVLTPAQRQTIYRTIVREPMAPPPPTVEYRVGTRLPPSVQLYPMPHDVVVEVPAVRNYQYMVVNHRVVLVDPVTSEVVAELQ